jgi:hypothetical protein
MGVVGTPVRNARSQEAVMNDQEYLQKVLEEQELEDGSGEIRDLEKIRDDVARLLREEFGSGPALHEGGSKAKGTMIREAYDLDLPYYLPRDDDSAGETIEEIYDNVEEALQKEYRTTRKGVAIRLLDCAEGADQHTDVIPGRYVYGSGGDSFLFPSSSDKKRLQTNLGTHVEHVKGSGVIEAIRLQKLWRTQKAIGVKTFALELLTIDLLKDLTYESLPEQMKHVWREFRDNMHNLSIEDPANSNNDLSGMLSPQVRAELKVAARDTLRTIEDRGWTAVFGELEAEKAKTVEALRRIALSTPAPAKPWWRG